MRRDFLVQSGPSYFDPATSVAASTVIHSLMSEDENWVSLKMRGRTVCLQKPKFLRDDTAGEPLDPELTVKGMCKEVSALDLLGVGDLVEKKQENVFARTHNVKILSTRWVAVDKRNGETKEQKSEHGWQFVTLLDQHDQRAGLSLALAPSRQEFNVTEREEVEELIPNSWAVGRVW